MLREIYLAACAQTEPATADASAAAGSVILFGMMTANPVLAAAGICALTAVNYRTLVPQP